MSQPKGNASGRNHGMPGFINNTREGFGKSRSSAEPDRHCDRRTKGNRDMKCERCYDYNSGVEAKSCKMCGHTNSVLR